MRCEEFEAWLDRGDPRTLSSEAREHAAGCARCSELAEALCDAAGAAMPASALAKAQQAATSQLKPVRPMAGPRAAFAVTALALLVVALLNIWRTGTHGWVARFAWQRTASYVGAGAVLVASLTAALREREPGLSIRAPWRYGVAALAALLWVGPFVVYEFEPETRFWKHGPLCCCNGLVVGLAAGMVIWLILRRGYLVAPRRSGWFAGVAAGCVAFIVQETYCPVVESAHAALWHGGVIAVLGTLGWLTGPRLFRQSE